MYAGSFIRRHSHDAVYGRPRRGEAACFQPVFRANGARPSRGWPLLFPLFLAVQGLRVWTILSLGRFWNAKILIVPNRPVVKKGPYRWIRHPNYAVVALEIALLPLLFQAHMTALLFSLLNALMLSVRISTEERALAALTDYREAFWLRPRFVPPLRGERACVSGSAQAKQRQPAVKRSH